MPPGSASRPPSPPSAQASTTPTSNPATPTATRSPPSTNSATRVPAPPKPKKPSPIHNRSQRARREPMKYCRFLLDNRPHYGKVEGRAGQPWIVDLAAAPEEDLAFHLAHTHAAAPSLDFESLAFEPIPLTSAHLLASVTPSKIICVGRNYRDHAKE